MPRESRSSYVAHEALTAQAARLVTLPNPSPTHPAPWGQLCRLLIACLVGLIACHYFA